MNSPNIVPTPEYRKYCERMRMLFINEFPASQFKTKYDEFLAFLHYAPESFDGKKFDELFGELYESQSTDTPDTD